MAATRTTNHKQLNEARSKRPPDKRRRICATCAKTTPHIRLGAWASMDRCHECRVCGKLVDSGEVVQIHESPPVKKTKAKAA